MLTRRLLVVLLATFAVVGQSASAGAAAGDYAAWGWSRPAGPATDFRWGGDLPRTRLGDGWFVQDCEGDAPLLCFDSRRGGAGRAEMTIFDLVNEPKIVADRDRYGDAVALRRHARRYYRIFAADIEGGCPRGYSFHPLRPRDARVAGRDGVRYGFVVRSNTGARVERVVSFATVTRKRLVIVSAEGLTRRACVAIEGPTFKPRQLNTVEPYLARLAARGKLPR